MNRLPSASGSPAPDDSAFKELLEGVRQEIARGGFESAERQVRKVLESDPRHLVALRLAASLRDRAGDQKNVAVLLKQIVTLYPDNVQALHEYADFLYRQGKLNEAAPWCARALKINPHGASLHLLMGLILIRTATLEKAEYHLREAYYQAPSDARAPAKLAVVLRTMGRMEEAERFFRIAYAQDPGNLENLLGWVKLEESRKNLPQAWRLQAFAETVKPGHPYADLTRALLQYRDKQYEDALASLDRIDLGQFAVTPRINYFFQRGQVLDRMGRYPEAFAAFGDGNRVVREEQGLRYDEAENAGTVQQLKRFFTREQLAQLPSAAPGEGEPVQPVFIVGFPRSGTSMMEQILSAHSHICAGDELIMLRRITERMPGWLGSQSAYPQCLDGLAGEDGAQALAKARSYYMAEVRFMGLVDPGARRFTDKMPLNETHLGMLKLVFPEAPVVHMIRHPLDVILSCYFNDLRHGGYFAFDLQSAAKHYLLISDLVEHYRAQLDQAYLAVRYEDMVEDVEGGTRRVLDFLGEPWEEACVDFHLNKRYSRTASYAQVTEKVYTGSVGRYRNYRKQLEPVIPMLEPVIERLGYSID